MNRSNFRSVIKYNTSSLSPGSALLLTLMIISILTATTLGAMAIRFDQFFAITRINDSAVAKIAADGGLSRLKEQLTSGPLTNPLVYDLNPNDPNPEQTVTADRLVNYKPNPRFSSFSIQPVTSSLPRCIAVAVLSPWTNDQGYLFKQTSSTNANPAMIFYYANIINDTPVGLVPSNTSLSLSDKGTPINQLTKMGHFYNPYAPTGVSIDTPDYWTINLGGPEDQFLTRMGANPSKTADQGNSYYRGLDMVYLPFLPRFTDSVLPASTATGVTRKTSTQLQTTFQNVVVSNNYKFWLDAAIDDQTVNRYGFGDLFSNTSPNRIRWLQPNLWNDSPDINNPPVYRTSTDVNSTQVNWETNKSQPGYTGGGTGWNVSVIKAAQPFAFFRFDNTTGSQSIIGGSNITAYLYGSLEGLRLYQPLTLTLFSKDPATSIRTPYSLQNGNQGNVYNAEITSITPTGGNYRVNIALASGTSNTPLSSSGSVVQSKDVDMMAINSVPYFSFDQSLTNLTLPASNGGTVNVSSNCLITSTFAGCPAAGDIVSFSKSGSMPVWGKVSDVIFNGSAISGFKVDQFRAYMKPVKDMAVSNPFDANIGLDATFKLGKKVAIYGGTTMANQYDGGFASESSDLWLYTPENDVWEYISTPGGPGRLAGASIVVTSGNKLVLTGGYWHEGTPASYGLCTNNFNPYLACYGDKAGNRIARRLNFQTYVYDLGTNTWSTINPPTDVASKIVANENYDLQVLSHLGDSDRTGDGSTFNWATTAKVSPLTLTLNGTPQVVDVNNAAGFAVGDNLNLISGGSSFRAWANVSGINYANKQLTIKVYGSNSGTSSASVPSLQLVSQTHATASSSCTGAIYNVSGSNYYACRLSSLTGLAVGDMVNLNNYSGTVIQKNLYGYITDIAPSKVDLTKWDAYFVTDERLPQLVDFRPAGLPLNLSGREVVDQSAVSWPSPAFGGTLAIDPKNAGVAYYWMAASGEGGATDPYGNIWQLNLSTMQWSFKQTTNAAISTNNFSLQVLSSPTVGYFSTSTSIAGSALVKSGGSWASSYTIYPEASSQNLSKIASNGRILIERKDHVSGGSSDPCNGKTTETFHGLISSAFDTNDLAASPPKLTITHDPNWGGDCGLPGNSSNANVTDDYDYVSKGDTLLGTNFNIKGNSSTGNVSISWSGSQNLNPIPVSNTVVNLFLPGSSEAYTFTVADRHYDAASASWVFTPSNNRIQSTPYVLPESTNQIAANSSATTAVSITNYASQITPSKNGSLPGGVEWYIQLTDNQPSWKARKAGSTTQIGTDPELPAARSDAAMGNYWDGTQTRFYLTGGTRGKYSLFWRENSAGDNTGSASWSLAKSSSLSNSDIPDKVGASMIVYVSGTQSKAVYIGGLSRQDYVGQNLFTKSSIYPKEIGLPDYQNLGNSGGQFAYYGTDPTPNDKTDDPYATLFTTATDRDYDDSFLPQLHNSFKLLTNTAGSYTACPYVADSSCNGSTGGQQLRNIGGLGRINSTVTSYGGYGQAASYAVLNPGSAFLSQGTRASLIATGPFISLYDITKQNQQDGYDPYTCDVTSASCTNNESVFGTSSTSFTSDKTMMFAGYAQLQSDSGTKGGAMLLTPAGIGLGLLSNSNNQQLSPSGSLNYNYYNGTAYSSRNGGSNKFSYCGNASLATQGPQAGQQYGCNTDDNYHLTWLPDPEDIVFLFNAAKALANTDTYKVVGYYAGIKRGYLVNASGGTTNLIVEEIAP